MAKTKIDLDQLNSYLKELKSLSSEHINNQAEFNNIKKMNYDLEMSGDVVKQLNEIGNTLSLIDVSLNTLIENTYTYLENRKKSFKNQETKAMKKLK
ncbi:MAG: hypothetical protein Q4Q31_04705 [Bacillota bacterium]|nr:hypothetical protein [Bacillota bacterium]